MTAITQRHLEILERRGLDAEMLVRHGVESFDKPGGDWIMIPYFLGGRVVNRKFRTIAGEKKFFQEPGGKKCFWNQDVLLDRSLAHFPVIITEGEFDAMIALQCGSVRVMSVPDGAPAEAQGGKMDGQKYSYLESVPLTLADAKEIVLATDGDGPGENLMNDLAIRLGKARCRWVKYPDGCKDLNDVYLKSGRRGVVETLGSQNWVQVAGVHKMSELPPVPDRQAHRIGIPVLDNHYRLRPMDFAVVTGIPSHGKSAVLTDIAGHMVQNHGWPVCMASFEQQPQVDLKRNLRTWFNRKRVIDQNEIELARADSWIDKNFCFIAPSEDDEITMPWVMERCATAVIRYGAKLIIIDPWNEMDHVRPSDMSLTEYTGFAIKEFKRFARKYQVHVIVAAHPAKQRTTETGGFSVPTLYDISDSAHWYNKPDVGLVVWRGKDKFGNDLSIIRVAKSRYHDQIGTPGDVQVTFDTNTNRFTPIDMGEVVPFRPHG